MLRRFSKKSIFLHALDSYFKCFFSKAYPKYQFNYGVKDGHTGDIKEQSEERDGDAVKGEYSLVEPDGTVRKVEYYDDGHSGFNAIVSKSGHAIHPQASAKIAIPAPAHGLLAYH